MNDLAMAAQQQSLPVAHGPQKHLKKPLSRMESIGLVSQFSMDVQSFIYFYGVQRLTMTVQQAELIKQSYAQVPAGVEEAYNKLIKQYTAAMEVIPQQASARLLEELRKIPTDLDGQGFLSKILAMLRG